MPPRPPSLPRAHFLGLPLEIRLKIYKELLVLQRPSWFLVKSFPSIDRGIWIVKHQGGILDTHLRCYTDRGKRQSLALFYTSWQIYIEAKTVFLGENTFQIREESVTIPQDLTLRAFTDRIGVESAHLLRYIDIHFPHAERTQTGKLEIRADTLKALHLLQSRCTGLTRLRFYDRWESHTFFHTYYENPASALAILSEVNQIVRDIASLKTVTVHTKSGVDPHLREFIRNLGWILNPIRI